MRAIGRRLSSIGRDAVNGISPISKTFESASRTGGHELASGLLQHAEPPVQVYIYNLTASHGLRKGGERIADTPTHCGVL